MAFRRSFRRFSAPRKRRSSFTRTITEPKRWEAANFYFEETMVASALAFDLVYWDLMSVEHFSNFGTDPRQLTDAIKSVDIGGVVWDTMLVNAFAGAATTHMVFQELLVTDRITNVGNPVSLTSADYTLSQAPVSGSGTGATDADFPIRIHRRRAVAPNILGVSSPSASVAALQAMPASFSNTWSTQRCRIKGALGDRQGLFLAHQLNAELDNSSVSVFVKISGTLYYRVRY